MTICGFPFRIIKYTLSVILCLMAINASDRLFAQDSAAYDANRLKVLYKERRWTLAVHELDKFLAVSPTSSEALQARAICYIRLGKYEQALLDLNKAISANPSNLGLYSLRSSVAKKLGDDTLANADRLRAIGQKLNQAPFKPAGRLTGTKVNERGHCFATKYETRHFRFFSDSSSEQTSWTAESLEGFVCFVDQRVCRLRGAYPLTVFVLKDENAMNEFLRQSFGYQPKRSLHGLFFASANAFVTYTDSGFGTFTHELMHKVLSETVKELDYWALEGIPTLFEKTYGYPTPSGWSFYFGYQNPWRLRELDKKWDSLSLTKIVQNSKTGDSSNESEERLIATFLNDNGNLDKYLELARRGKKNGFNTYLEGAFNCSLNGLEPKFRDYLAKIRSRWTELQGIPASKTCSSEGAFLKFKSENSRALTPILGR